MTRIGLWRTGQRSASTCQTRRIGSRHRLEGNSRGSDGGETPRRRDGHPGRGGFPLELKLRRGQAVGLVAEVAEGALLARGFGGEGAGGLVEKLKLGKQKADIPKSYQSHPKATPRLLQGYPKATFMRASSYPKRGKNRAERQNSRDSVPEREDAVLH